MGKIKLDLGSDDSNDEEEITINKGYAENYEKWRRNELFQQLKDKYKNKIPEDEDEDESSSESEPEWTAEDEKSFFRTLGALKANDPNIYNKDVRFFKEKTEDEKSETSKAKKQKEKGMTLRDYEVALVTEKEGRFDDEDDEEKLKSEGYYEKSARLKEEFKKAIESDEESEDGFLKKKTKTQAEKQKEEEDFSEWLKGEKKELNIDPEDGIVKLKSKWSEPLDEGEAFLRDYFLDKKYEVDDDDRDPLDDYNDMIEIEKEFDKADNFEQKYNFRFEEPDHDFIKQFPRTVKESIRKAPEKRKEKREERKKRKEEEKKQQKEEIKMLKSLKKREIEDKLKKLKEASGDDSLPITIEELEKDFDPKEYDEKMKELFTDDYYGNADDVEKPVFSDLSDDGEMSDYDNMPIGSKSSNFREVKEENYDDGDDDQGEDEEGNSEPKPREKTSSRKKKRNSKFKEMVARKKPLFDPKEKNFEDYLNEYYALDYEDILPGNVVTKFKYRNVPENNFGLTTEEILAADDKQLNQWVSVKKASQYRTDREEEYDKRAYSNKGSNPAIKAKVFGKKREPQVNNNQQGPKKNNKKKFANQKNTATAENGQQEGVQGKKNNRRKNKNKSQKKKAEKIKLSTGVDVDRLKAYNISNQAIKRKVFGNQSNFSAKKQKTE